MKPSDIFEVLAATWPSSAVTQVGPWLIRDGQGGGKRVSSAIAIASVEGKDVELAATSMSDLGQVPLFMLRPDDVELDSILAQKGYVKVDPTLLYHGPVFEADVPKVTGFDIWPPLQIMTDIWAAGGIGPQRMAVMNRADEPKSAILGRIEDRAAGVAFVAMHGTAAMVHAVEVLPAYRRKGLARSMMHVAARWAASHGATDFTLATTQANLAAQSLYSSLGLSVVGQYHYRMKP